MFFLCSSFVLVMVGSIAIADQTAFTDHLNRPTLNQMTRILPLSSSGDADSLEYSQRFGNAKSNSLATLISPLAGIAFMAAAAAVAVNPVYLTLTGRKKRDLFTIMSPPPSPNRKFKPGMTQKIQELQTLEKYLSSVPKETDYQQQIMSMYLTCSGYTRENNVCLDRIFCEYGNAQSKLTEEERDVLSIVLYNIMSNQFLTTDYKHRLRSAARVGRDFQLCGRYECPALSERSFSD